MVIGGAEKRVRTYGTSTIFFFSSRRRHTRCSRDWSSDVCSSDLAALAHRAHSGAGQHLDLALLDSQIALLAYQNTNYFATGVPPERIGNLHPNIEIGRASCRERV